MAEGQEVLTLRLSEKRAQKLFVDTSRNPETKMVPPSMEQGRIVLCEALCQSIREEEWNELHEKLTDVSKNLEVKKAGGKEAGLGKLGLEEKSLRKDFFSSNKSKLKPLTGDRLCVKALCQFGWLTLNRQDRHVEVCASEVSYVSWDRENDPWPD